MAAAAWGILTPAHAASVDRYVRLRSEMEAAKLSISSAAESPDRFRGRVIELRGTVTGVASSGETSRLIVKCGSGDYVVLCEGVPAPSSGAVVAILAVVGEGSVLSLSDLKLVEWCFEGELASREAAAAEAARKKAQWKSTESQPARAKRGERPTSRGYDMREIVSAYRRAIASFNPRLSRAELDKITDTILRASARNDVDPRLVVALVLAESHFRPEATSRAGAMGLGQLMPGTAKGLGVRNAYDPEENLTGAIRLIKGHLDKLSGKAAYHELTWEELRLALACYNAGPGAVKKYGGVPPYRETQGYVQRVIKYYKKLCGIGD